MKTNVSSLQSLSGVQQQKKGLSKIAFPCALHILFPQPSVITGMHVSWSWPGNCGTSRSQWSSSQLALVGIAYAVLPAQLGLQDVPSATGQPSPGHSDRGACCNLSHGTSSCSPVWCCPYLKVQQEVCMATSFLIDVLNDAWSFLVRRSSNSSNEQTRGASPWMGPVQHAVHSSETHTASGSQYQKGHSIISSILSFTVLALINSI